MLRTPVSAVSLGLLVAALATGQQPSLIGTEVTVATGAEQMRKWHAHLRGEVEKAARTLAKLEEEQGPLDPKCAAPRRAALELVGKAEDVERDYQALIDLRDRGGKAAAGKRTLAAWLEEARAAAKQAAGHDHSAIDDHARAASADAAMAVPKLAAHFLKKAKTDREKARAAAVWMAEHIAYDAEAASGPKPAEAALRQKRGDGVALAALYDALARACGLKAQVIPGNTRVLESDRFFARATHTTPTGINYAAHAWNAVMVEGRWRFVDPTYFCAPRGGKVQPGKARPFDATYFLAAPQRLIWTHLPDDERWELLARPVKLKEHLGMAMVRPAFFRHGLGLGLHEQGQVRVKDAFVFSVRVPDGASLLPQVVIKGAKDEAQVNALVQCYPKGGFQDICVGFPKAGTYFVRVFAGKHGSTSGPWDWALEYQAEARVAAKGGGVPKSYPAFQDKRCHVYAPLTATLRAGPHTFKLSVPGATRVAVQTGGRFRLLPENGGVFEAEAEVVEGEVIVGAEFPDRPGTYQRMLKYEAR
jgi:transglutaminase-like putative cysteine protease